MKWLCWYPSLPKALPEQWAFCELSPFGAHSPEIDEGLCMEGMLVGSNAAGAKQSEPVRDLLPGRRR